MKKIGWLGIACIIGSVLLALLHTSQPVLSMLKCLLMAYGITLFTYAVLTCHLHKRVWFLYALGIMILCVYTLLALDTYLFHFLTWFPGILRYALFSTYGLWYLVFMLPGCALAFMGNEQT